jgi:sugar phosphate isomerase/epimerase
VPRAMRLGIKVHWRDVDAMVDIAEKHGASVLEYQMLPRDLEENRERAFEALLPYRERFEIRVHQPEAYVWEGALRFLDIASPDAEERARSTAALGEVARHAMELRAKALVIHPGGIWRGNVGGSAELLRDSLEDLPRHVKLLLENMPWFYDTRSIPGVPSGESPAAFRMPQGLARAGDLVDGYVLDVSHAYLCVDSGSLEMPRLFARELGTRILHVHANGSRARRGGEGEGTPFHDSDYGADYLRELFAHLPSETVIVPEIMDGHRDGGRLFDEGLAFLREVLA